MVCAFRRIGEETNGLYPSDSEPFCQFLSKSRLVLGDRPSIVRARKRSMQTPMPYRDAVGDAEALKLPA